MKKTSAPLDWAGFTNRGTERQEAGDLEGAIADFTAAIELSPGELAPRYNRGNARALSGDLEGAFADYTEALRISPEFAPAHQRRGLARQRMGDLEGAMRDLDTALRLDSTDPLAHGERAALRALIGDFDGAVSDAERALEIAPPDWKHRAGTHTLLETLREAQARSKRPPTKKADMPKKTTKKASTKKAAPPSAVEVLEDVLGKAGWGNAERTDEPDGFITWLMRVDEEESPVAATVVRMSEEIERIVLYVFFRAKAKKARRADIAEFVMRANWDLGDGNFEMDLDTGEVRFKISLDYTGTLLSPLLVRNIILDAMDVTELYSGALEAVMSGKASPKDALAAAEEGFH
ncbi:tetratricopeptide repeat protein [Polyangium aurulentum]|uniref:tetratricopeptide repeat protein n=1 Tax=Polyangium aurulentum TaxID=2567896 RepID=UPI00146D73AC|nr:tetratricopeptide repeat protein [Polyangium aurulentum]UQA61754.1 tetratricopeptide repeat protein [Polyangium aurulentum]